MEDKETSIVNDIPQTLSYVAWLSLPTETRQKLVALFEIPKTGESVIRVGAIVDGNISAEQTSDGYTPKDLQVITLEKMQEVAGSKSTNFYELFGQIVKDIDEYIETESGAFAEGDIAVGLGREAEEKPLSTQDGKHAEKTTKTKKAKAK